MATGRPMTNKTVRVFKERGHLAVEEILIKQAQILEEVYLTSAGWHDLVITADRMAVMVKQDQELMELTVELVLQEQYA
jgi:hypothetical protein